MPTYEEMAETELAHAEKNLRAGRHEDAARYIGFAAGRIRERQASGGSFPQKLADFIYDKMRQIYAQSLPAIMANIEGKIGKDMDSAKRALATLEGIAGECGLKLPQAFYQLKQDVCETSEQTLLENALAIVERHIEDGRYHVAYTALKGATGRTAVIPARARTLYAQIIGNCPEVLRAGRTRLPVVL